METKEYKFMDKSKWTAGEWQSEPDKIQWTDEATGLPCIIKRNDHGSWCGYVGVPEGHKLFGKDFMETESLSVHGGITYTDFCTKEDPEHGICHIPGPGEPDRVWWLGFDCAHAGDYVPAFADTMKRLGGKYRNLSYVKAETARLAKQLKEDQ